MQFWCSFYGHSGHIDQLSLHVRLRVTHGTFHLFIAVEPERRSLTQAETRNRNMLISELKQKEQYYTVIMRIAGKAGLRPHWASSSSPTLSPPAPHLSPTCLPNPHFFHPSLALYIHSCCIAGQDVVHFNDFERSCVSLLAWFSSFAMSHSKIPSFYVHPLTHQRAFIFFRKHTHAHAHLHKRRSH